MQSRSSTVVRSLLRTFVALAVSAMALFRLIGPAAAKGPESVTITGPGIDQPIELMDADNTDLLVRLMEQTGLWYATGDLPSPLGGPPGELGPGYTLTWINAGPPDKSVDERTIRQLIYLDARNGPVIHTPDQIGLRGWGPGVIGWFAAPSELRDTLVELGAPIAAGTSFSDAAHSGTAADTFLYLGVASLALVVGLVGLIAARRMFGLSIRSSRRSRTG